VVFAQEGVWLKEKSVVNSGHIAANSVSSGPYLSDSSEVVIGQSVKFKDPASRLYGDSILLRDKSEVYDVYYNEIDGDGTVKGTRHTPLTLPVISTLPAIPTFTPGTQNITVDEKDSLTLNPGNYDTLRARKKATITFTGGIYTFSSWDIGQQVKIEFTAPSEIRIAGKLDTNEKTTLGPKAGGGIICLWLALGGPKRASRLAGSWSRGVCGRMAANIFGSSNHFCSVCSAKRA